MVTLAHSFASLLFGATFDVASYNRWLLAKRSDAHAHAFRWHRKLLQYLQLREADGSGAAATAATATAADQDQEAPPSPPPRRWVLKTPWFSHGPVLEAALAEYPDALVIATHRKPSVVVGSSTSVHIRTYGAGSDAVDARRIGASQLWLMEAMMESNLATRQKWRREQPRLAERIADLSLGELKRDPLGAVAGVYQQLGLELTAEAKAAMRAWLDTKQVDHGKHKFELGDFGLSEASVAQRPTFRRYCDEFGLEECSGHGTSGASST